MTVHRLKVLIQIVALFAFSIQLAYAIEKFLARPSMTNGATTTINSLGSPIAIALCRNVQFNFSNELGYSGPGKYFRGLTVNSSFVSWTGKTGNLTANETFFSLFEPSTEKFDTFNQTTGTDTIILPHGLCKVVQDEPRNMIQRGVLPYHWKNAVHLTVNDLDNDYYIYVYDPQASPKFHIPIPLTLGDNVMTKTNSHGSVSYYKITLKIVRNELEDGTCVQYPDSDGHQSFNDCVEQENQRKAMPVLGCMPAWMSGQDRCNKKIPPTPAVKHISYWIYSVLTGSKNGFHYDSAACRRPCNHILVNARLLNTKSVKKDVKITYYSSVF